MCSVIRTTNRGHFHSVYTILCRLHFLSQSYCLVRDVLLGGSSPLMSSAITSLLFNKFNLFFGPLTCQNSSSSRSHCISRSLNKNNLFFSFFKLEFIDCFSAILVRLMCRSFAATCVSITNSPVAVIGVFMCTD